MGGRILAGRRTRAAKRSLPCIATSGFNGLIRLLGRSCAEGLFRCPEYRGRGRGCQGKCRFFADNQLTIMWRFDRRAPPSTALRKPRRQPGGQMAGAPDLGRAWCGRSMAGAVRRPAAVQRILADSCQITAAQEQMTTTAWQTKACMRRNAGKNGQSVATSGHLTARLRRIIASVLQIAAANNQKTANLSRSETAFTQTEA